MFGLDWKLMYSETNIVKCLAQQRCQLEYIFKFFFIMFLVADFCIFFRRRIVQQTTGTDGQQCGMACSSCSIMWYQYVTKCDKMSHDVTICDAHTQPCVIWCDNMWECVITWAQRSEDYLWFSESLSNHSPPQYLFLIKLNGVDNISKHQMRPFSEETFTITE